MLAYLAHNTITGKRYVGVTTVNCEWRWCNHLYRAREGAVKTALYQSIRKHGASAFVVEPIASAVPWASLADLFELERQLIAQEGTKVPGGYNMTDGGDGTVGYRYTDEQRSAIRGRKVSAETRMKMSASRTGKKKSASSVEKFKATRKSKPWSCGAHWKGKELSASHKEKLVAAWTPERRARQAVIMAERQRSWGNG